VVKIHYYRDKYKIKVKTAPFSKSNLVLSKPETNEQFEFCMENFNRGVLVFVSDQKKIQGK